MEQITVLFGGAAGDGIRAVGFRFASIMSSYGWYAFQYDDYQSLIRGGHNFSVVTARRGNRVYSHWKSLDAIVALNQDTVDIHLGELKKGGWVVYDSNRVTFSSEHLGVGLPLSDIVKQRKLDQLYRNTVALGALLATLGVPLEVGLEAYRGDELNRELLREGYERASAAVGVTRKLERGDTAPGPLLSGAAALSAGLLRGGLKVFLAYPMTPSTPILHTLAQLQEKFGVAVYQPESEIAVANMALGAAYAGARTAVATSGGGFDLMTEALSLAGMSETPIVFILAQRPGPSTGLPTYTSQGDLKLALGAGHGEFPRVVLAPGDVDEAFTLAVKSLNIAWKWQVPVILLVDKHLVEGTSNASLSDDTPVEWGKVARSREELEAYGFRSDYARYKITPDGVSPIAIPGIEGAVVKANSYEHDEYGVTTEHPETVTKMVDKRFSKLTHMVEEFKRETWVKVYGDPDSRLAVVSWGSTKGAILEALRLSGLKARFVQFLLLEPFPVWEAEKRLEGVERIVSVENNRSAYFSELLESKTKLKVVRRVVKYDGRPFTPDELAPQLEKVFAEGW